MWTPLIPATMSEEKLESFGARTQLGRAAVTDFWDPSAHLVLASLHATLARARRHEAARPKTQREMAFCALGPIAEAFVTGPAGAGNTRLGAGPAELSTLAAAHASSPLSTPWPGWSRSAGGEPRTSSLPARAYPSPPPPGRPGAAD
ncbi:MAG: hypothetical protein QOD96_7632, partial [Pseudonocardiales bacterium]|nr:hypothetical protein [Pseudonocardiales bacterium]